MGRQAASTESLAADAALPVPPEPVRALRLRIGRGGASLASITPVGASTFPVFAGALALRAAARAVKFAIEPPLVNSPPASAG